MGMTGTRGASDSVHALVSESGRRVTNHGFGVISPNHIGQFVALHLILHGGDKRLKHQFVCIETNVRKKSRVIGITRMISASNNNATGIALVVKHLQMQNKRPLIS